MFDLFNSLNAMVNNKLIATLGYVFKSIVVYVKLYKTNWCFHLFEFLTIENASPAPFLSFTTRRKGEGYYFPN